MAWLSSDVRDHFPDIFFLEVEAYQQIFVSERLVSCLTDFKNLQTLELCGGGISDAGVRSIKDLTLLTSLNLSQNMRLTDNALPFISGE